MAVPEALTPVSVMVWLFRAVFDKLSTIKYLPDGALRQAASSGLGTLALMPGGLMDPCSTLAREVIKLFWLVISAATLAGVASNTNDGVTRSGKYQIPRTP